MPLEMWEPGQGFDQDRVKLLVYGASGAGKTRFAATAPAPIFADAENGMASIQTSGVARWPIETIADWGALTRFLMTEEHDFKTLVVDSINEMQRLLLDFVLGMPPDVGKRPFGNQPNIGDQGYALNLFQDGVIRRIKSLPMNVILICSTSGFVGNEGTIEPALIGKKTVGMVTRYMDVVGYQFVTGKANALPIHRLGFHLPHAVAKDRSSRLPAAIDDPQWEKLTRYWNGSITAPALPAQGEDGLADGAMAIEEPETVHVVTTALKELAHVG